MSIFIYIYMYIFICGYMYVYVNICREMWSWGEAHLKQPIFTSATCFLAAKASFYHGFAGIC